MTNRVLNSVGASSGCEVRVDSLSRQLYATDASIYRIEPAGVAFPRNADQAARLIRAAAEAGIPIIPRGAGSGLVGGCLGQGLIVDFSRHNRAISGFDPERRTVRVGPGVVLDQLNAFAKSHGLRFGPDVATSSRATLGGMIANNSSGSHVPVYGTTADHVVSLEVAMADGRLRTVSADPNDWPEGRGRIGEVIEATRAEIESRMPAGLLKRWPGYGLDRWLRHPGNPGDMLAGSEGTLAAIVSAELQLVPLPRRKGLGLIFFASVAEAMQATVALLDLRPAAIEHIDRVLFDQTRGQISFQAARDLMHLDAQPCESILLVEFYGDCDDQLAALDRMQLGMRRTILHDPAQMNLVWALRKAGLALLAGCPGPAKPVTGIEDAAIPPRHLPEFVRDLSSLLDRLDLRACFYGHAASGLLHVRPVLDLHRREDLDKLRQLGGEVSSLVREFKGSLAGEHGVGMARTEYMPEQLGDAVLQTMREVKRIFDPDHAFNPGKIFGGEDFRIDSRLRWGDGYRIQSPPEPRLVFARKNESFVGNLEQCNGCGGCRKDSPLMCPTFAATGEEIMSTRGRANAIRSALDGRGRGSKHVWDAPEIREALSYCLACKGCTAECPSNVNMTMLKAELLHAKHQARGLSLVERVVGAVDQVGKLGCTVAGLANAPLRWRWFRSLVEGMLGFNADRPLPAFASERFDRWFRRRPRLPRSTDRRKVILWDDTFVRYHEPHIGKAAVAVLEAAGFEVELVAGRVCCGRPAFSQGWLDRAARLGETNLALLDGVEDSTPIVFLEPSCWSMFVEDYVSLQLPGAEAVARHCFLFESFLQDLLSQNARALAIRPLDRSLIIHAHCHAKSLMKIDVMKALGDQATGQKATLLNTGCCGMAGAFGAMRSNDELSGQIAAPLVRQVNEAEPGTIVVASGTSCRHQIEHFTQAKPKHMAEVWRELLVD